MAYWGWHPLFNPADIVTFGKDKDLSDELHVQMSIRYDLGKLPDSQVRSKLELALQRGYLTSTSGKAFKIYCLLAAAFDFPVFCLGAGGYIIVSYQRNDTDAAQKVSDLIAHAKTMAKLADPHAYQAKPGYGPGHNDHWMTAQFVRPKKLTDQGLCNLLGVQAIGELVPKENRTRALQALITGQQIAVERVTT